MSATGRNDVRRADDSYATPDWCVKAIWPKLSAYDTCLDPCAGEGRLLLALQDLASSPMYRGIEINEERATLCAMQNGFGCVVGDALKKSQYVEEIWRTSVFQKPYDLICTNPPYSFALDFIKAALASKANEIAMLLRLNFLGSMKRAKFFRENPCDVYILPKRPSFAVFLSCKAIIFKKTDAAPSIEIPESCGWKASYPTDVELPYSCPSCGSQQLSKCTSDATEYAWFVWPPKGYARGRGHWEILHVDP